MSHKTVLAALVITAGLATGGCRQKIGGIEYSLDPSKVVAGHNMGWHDIYFTNNSGQSLHEVHVTLTVIGEDGVPHEGNRYYASWPEGRTVQVSLSRAESPVNVQKISLSGTCDEGNIDSTWTPAKP